MWSESPFLSCLFRCQSRWFVCYFSFLFVCCFSFPVIASNLVISTPKVGSMNLKTRTIPITFHVSWEDSWRGSLYENGQPENWDAAWVFCKFSRKNSDYGVWDPWTPCNLSKTGYSAPSGAALDIGQTEGVGKGAFLYSSQSKDFGPVQYDGVKLEWLAGEQGVGPTDFVEVKLFALEMVYVPRGSFWIGDPKMDDDPVTGTPNAFRVSGCQNPLRNCAYKILSEGEIDVGEVKGYLFYSDKGDMGTPLAEFFPKGYNAFYVMKYELSQGQYRDFLNSLTLDEQKAELGGQLPAPGQFVFSRTDTIGAYRNTIRRDPKDPEESRRAARFGCDATGGNTPDGVLDQADDGEWVAMNYMGLKSILSYASWAGLRPLTEFEYEKAARGTREAVHGEFAWGSAINNVGNVNNKNIQAPFQADEYSNCSHVNYHVGGCNYGGALSSVPYRVGSFLSQNQVTSNPRYAMGAGYYGAEELSGNVFEPAVSMGTKTGRHFRGTHGDGSVNIPSDWPQATDDIILRGGAFSENNCFVATRQYLLTDKTSQLYKVGARFVRTAPLQK